jgi:hypothetical protein
MQFRLLSTFLFGGLRRVVWTGNVDRSIEKVADTCLLHTAPNALNCHSFQDGLQVSVALCQTPKCITSRLWNKNVSHSWVTICYALQSNHPKFGRRFTYTSDCRRFFFGNGHQDRLIIYSGHRNNLKREHKLKWHITTVYSQLAQKEILQESIIIGQSKS